MSNFSNLPAQIVTAIQSVVGSSPVGLHEPSFNGNEWNYLKECLDSTYVSSVGKFVDRFEDELASLTGAKKAVAVMNGTAALHMALLMAGVSPGDEVLVPAISFVATANAVHYCGAIPHFLDSNEENLGVDPISLREYLTTISEFRNSQCINKLTGRVIRAVVPVHIFGHPVNMSELIPVASDFGLAVVEDAAESLGSTINGQYTGTFGLVGALSFNGNKTITTGGGGAMLFNDVELAARAKHITTTAKIPHKWNFVHDEVGYNYRMPNINAALGCAQLEQLLGFIDKKRELYEHYQQAFLNIPGASILKEPKDCKSNYWLQTLILDRAAASERDNILAATNNSGIMTRPLWALLSTLPPYAACPKMDLRNAFSIEKRIINLPSSFNMAGH